MLIKLPLSILQFFQFPITESDKIDKICFECSKDLMELYNFRENCSIWFEIENETNRNHCCICLGMERSLNCVFIRDDSSKIFEILMEICAFDLNVSFLQKMSAKR